jgi:hypothetical protein
MQQDPQRDCSRSDQRQAQPRFSRVGSRLIQPRRNWIARVHAKNLSHLPHHVNGATEPGLTFIEPGFILPPSQPNQTSDFASHLCQTQNQDCFANSPPSPIC